MLGPPAFNFVESDMHAVILLAGYGSRLNRNDFPHKSLLPFGEETLLSRHLTTLKELGMHRIHLVLGYNKEKVRGYVLDLGLDLPLHFIDNDLYRTTGNTLSMVLGLRHCPEDVLIMDGDVLYPRSVLMDFVRQSPPSSFAVVPADIHNAECAKVLLEPEGRIAAFITKRQLTNKEKSRFEFGGEAIGFFKLSAPDVQRFLALYEEKEDEYMQALWEIPFTDFAERTVLSAWHINEPGCFEIDTHEEYEHALAFFKEHPGY